MVWPSLFHLKGGCEPRFGIFPSSHLVSLSAFQALLVPPPAVRGVGCFAFSLFPSIARLPLLLSSSLDPPGTPFSSAGDLKYSPSPLLSAFLKWQNAITASPWI